MVTSPYLAALADRTATTSVQPLADAVIASLNMLTHEDVLNAVAHSPALAALVTTATGSIEAISAGIEDHLKASLVERLIAERDSLELQIQELTGKPVRRRRDLPEVRAWARRHGWSALKDRGPIPEAAVEAFDLRHQMDQADDEVVGV